MVTVAVFVGESQQSRDATGSLIRAAESVGNFINLQLKNQVGQWSLRMMSSDPYTVRVIGERLTMPFHRRNRASSFLSLNRTVHFLLL